jgi:hypothetical protein
MWTRTSYCRTGRRKEGSGTGRWASVGLDGLRRDWAREGKGCPLILFFLFFFIFDFQNLHRNKRWRGGRILETFSKLDFQSFQSLISIRIGREEYR